MALAVALCLPSGLGAQPVRGSVRDSSTGAPVSAAVVVLFDARDTVVTRTITDSRGIFTFPAPTVSATQLRVVRIGYRPVTMPLPAAAAQIEIALVHIVPTLEAVRVATNKQCPDDDETARAMSLWSQARAALLAGIVAREARPATMGGVVFQRLDLGGPWEKRSLGSIVRQSGSAGTWRGTTGFHADTSAAFLEAHGYSTPDVNNWPMIHHPDDAVLLDDSFVRTHCFKTAGRSDDHRGEAGVEFQPTGDRAGMTEIRGTMWIDTAKASLQSVEFTYVHSPYELRTQPPNTGWLKFAVASNGVPLLTSWSVRHVADYSLTRRIAPGTSQTVKSGIQLVAFNEPMQEDGGGLAFATWGDGGEWNGALPSFTGRLIDRRSRQPVGGVRVSLLTGGAAVLTDSTGQFRFPYVAPGPHVLEVYDTAYSFVAPLDDKQDASFKDFNETHQFTAMEGVFWTLIAGFTRMMSPAPNQAWILVDPDRNPAGTIEISSRRERLREACNERPGADTLGVLAGDVVRSGTPAIGSAISAHWGDGRGVTRATRTDELGRFMVCGIPHGATVNLLTTVGDAKPVTTEVTMAPGRVTLTTVRLAP